MHFIFYFVTLQNEYSESSQRVILTNVYCFLGAFR